MPDGWTLVQPAAQADGWTLVKPAGPASAEQFTQAAPQPEGSAAGRFVSNAAEMLNPVAAVQGVVHAVAHPVDTAKSIYDASAAQFAKASDMAKQGRYVEALGHLGGMVPIIGPAAAAAGEQIASGDVAGGLGKGVGLLAPLEAARAVKVAGKAVRAATPEGLRASIADSLAAKAAGNVADVMTPKVGANKTRFAGMAERSAPELPAEMSNTWTRQGFHGNVQGGLAQAEQALDAATDARLSARTFDTEPILNALYEKRKALTAQAVDASKSAPKVTERTSAILDASGKPITVASQSAEPLGADVVPKPNQPRVAQIDQAIAEIKQLGPSARYEDLRRIRAAYDGPAKTVYNPSVTQDFLAKNGEKMGAADVTGTLREHLAKFDPQTAKANAQYSLMRTANDALDAVAEVEKTRPTVGRRIIARMAGTILGEQAGGVGGAMAGYALGPSVDAIASSGWTTQLKTAQLMSKLATAIRRGSEGEVASLTYQIKRLSAQAATLTNGLTSPSEPQTAPAGAR